METSEELGDRLLSLISELSDGFTSSGPHFPIAVFEELDESPSRFVGVLTESAKTPRCHRSDLRALVQEAFMQSVNAADCFWISDYS